MAAGGGEFMAFIKMANFFFFFFFAWASCWAFIVDYNGGESRINQVDR